MVLAKMGKHHHPCFYCHWDIGLIQVFPLHKLHIHLSRFSLSNWQSNRYQHSSIAICSVYWVGGTHVPDGYAGPQHYKIIQEWYWHHNSTFAMYLTNICCMDSAMMGLQSSQIFSPCPWCSAQGSHSLLQPTTPHRPAKHHLPLSFLVAPTHTTPIGNKLSTQRPAVLAKNLIQLRPKTSQHDHCTLSTDNYCHITLHALSSQLRFAGNCKLIVRFCADPNIQWAQRLEWLVQDKGKVVVAFINCISHFWADQFT